MRARDFAATHMGRGFVGDPHRHAADRQATSLPSIGIASRGTSRKADAATPRTGSVFPQTIANTNFESRCVTRTEA
jgi:hypothetical protein